MANYGKYKKMFESKCVTILSGRRGKYFGLPKCVTTNIQHKVFALQNIAV